MLLPILQFQFHSPIPSSVADYLLWPLLLLCPHPQVLRSSTAFLPYLIPLSQTLRAEALSPWKPAGHASQGIRQVIPRSFPSSNSKSRAQPCSRTPARARLPSLPPFPGVSTDPHGRPSFLPSCGPSQPSALLAYHHIFLSAPQYLETSSSQVPQQPHLAGTHPSYHMILRSKKGN